MNELATILGSGVLAAIISGVIALRNNDRQIKSSNVMQERTKWREKIRKLAIAVQESQQTGNTEKLNIIRSKFVLNLNPHDTNDQEIITAIDQIIENPKKTEKVVELIERISLLLKHDWERAKEEADPLNCYYVNNRRISYEEYKKNKI